MATNTVSARQALTNGVSFALSHVIASEELDAADDSFTFDFGVDYYLVPSIVYVASTGAVKALTGALIDTSVKGQVTITEVDGTFAFTATDILYVTAQRKGL